MEFRLLIDMDAVEILDGLPKRSRARILSQFQKMRSFPGNYSDCHEYDTNGRRIEISIVSAWAIHYWIDFADRHVKVLAIKPADQ